MVERERERERKRKGRKRGLRKRKVAFRIEREREEYLVDREETGKEIRKVESSKSHLDFIWLVDASNAYGSKVYLPAG